MSSITTKTCSKKAGLNVPTKLSEAWTLDQLNQGAVKLTLKDSNGNIKVYGIMPLPKGTAAASHSGSWNFGILARKAGA